MFTVGTLCRVSVNHTVLRTFLQWRTKYISSLQLIDYQNLTIILPLGRISQASAIAESKTFIHRSGDTAHALA